MAFIERIPSVLVRIALAFLFAFFAWVLIRGGRTAYVVVVGAAAAAWVASRFVPAAVNAGAGRWIARARRGAGILLRPFPIGVIVVLALAARLAWALHFDVVLFSDFQQFHEVARQFAAGDMSALGASKSPATTVFYGAVYAAAGPRLIGVHIANAILGAVQVLLVYLIATRAFGARTPGRFAALAVALFPSAVMATAYPNSEALFVTMMLLVVWQLQRLAPALASMPAPRAALWAALVGAECAVLHLTRNIGIVYTIKGAVVLLLWARATPRTSLVFGAALVVTLVACLTPQIVHNHRTYGSFSIQSSKYAGLNLLSGTNRRSDGQHNDQDVNSLRNRYGLDDEHWNEAMRVAKRRAYRRIAEDVPGFLGFALTRKFDVMWGDDGYAAVRHPTCMIAGRRVPWRFVATRYYFVMMALAALGTLSCGARGHPAGLMLVLAAGLLGATFFLHLFIEVQPRYHLAMNFVVPLIAAALVAGRDAPAEAPQSLT